MEAYREKFRKQYEKQIAKVEDCLAERLTLLWNPEVLGLKRNFFLI